MPLKIFKAAGFRVAYRVRQLISAGDRHRDAGCARLAAISYKDAVERDPSLYHIWMQLGHALKDDGQLEQARSAYERARCLVSDLGEPDLFIGQVDRKEGRVTEAVTRYLYAVQAEDTVFKAALEIISLLNLPQHFPVGGVIDFAGSLVDRQGVDRWVDQAQRTCAPGAMTAMLDISDVVYHFREHRRPTGIQRVQLEVAVASTLADAPEAAALCAVPFSSKKLVWINPARLARLRCLSVEDGADGEWECARVAFYIEALLSPPLAIPTGAVVVNLGPCWATGYMEVIESLKLSSDFSFIVFIHDLIPFVKPHFFLSSSVKDFKVWLCFVLRMADGFLVNSSATRSDLMEAAKQLGRSLPADSISQVALDGNLLASRAAPGVNWLNEIGLRHRGFVLFVATLESRKNHILAFKAWATLISRHGADRVPPLVCAGRNGWLNEAALTQLKNDALRDKIVRLERVGDAELIQLYQSCLFTIYPSLYEGWGLPISESLSQMRVPIVARNSSLEEAGRGFAMTFVSDSVEDFARALEWALFEDDFRQAKEEDITLNYRPRSWNEIATEVCVESRRIALI